MTSDEPRADAGAGTPERLHALDALRASMMLLGLVLHAGNSYLAHPVPDAWPWFDADRSLVADVGAYLIHGFRMPVFFALSGFFAALLLAQRGPRAFLGNRVGRVLVPLALFALPLWAADEIAVGLARDPRLESVALAVRSLGLPRSLAFLGHLWFLYYLLVFCLALILVVLVGRRWCSRGRAARMGVWLTRWWAPMVPALPLSLVLFGEPFAVLNPSGSLVPEASTALGYGVMFGVGAWLYLRRDALAALPGKAPVLLGGALLLDLACLLLLLTQVGAERAVALGAADFSLSQALLATCSALSTSLATFGIVGAALRLVKGHHPLVRYASDASYWIYLVHHAQVIAVCGLLGGWRAPALLKLAIVVTVVLSSCLLSYHLLVRSSPIGALLNGRRYPFRLPWP